MEEKNISGKASEGKKDTKTTKKVGETKSGSTKATKVEGTTVVRKQEMQKDEPLFKKVVTVHDEQRKKKKEETVFTKLVKALLIVVIILIIAYLIFFVRNIVIFNDIVAKMDRFMNIANYSYESITRTNNSDITTTVKYNKKDNRSSVEFMRNDESLISFWIDTEKQEKVVVYPESNRAEISNNTDGVIMAMPVMNELDTGTVRAFLSLGTLIYSELYHGRDCYVIELDQDQKVWIDKETGLVLRREYPSNYVEYVNIQFDTNQEIARPDLTGYEVMQ